MTLLRFLWPCVIVLCFILPCTGQGQVRGMDSIPAAPKVDTLARKAADSTHRKPRSEASKAAIRSAIIPGLGQAFNKKYWKIPIVYAALAVPAYLFFDNKNWYDKARYAYAVKYYNDTATVTHLPTDGIDPALQPLSSEQTKIYRNEVRKNMDYSVLAFLLIWGLQVADAAVDAHLHSFNVTDDLSLRFKPFYHPAGQTFGITMVMGIGKNSASRTVITR
jgi:Family of unknown function (DUF5683)